MCNSIWNSGKPVSSIKFVATLQTSEYITYCIVSISTKHVKTSNNIIKIVHLLRLSKKLLNPLSIRMVFNRLALYRLSDYYVCISNTNLWTVCYKSGLEEGTVQFALLQSLSSCLQKNSEHFLFRKLNIIFGEI